MDSYEISIFLAQKPHERYQPAQRRYWGNIYRKNLLTFLGPNYVETFLDCFWMTDISGFLSH